MSQAAWGSDESALEMQFSKPPGVTQSASTERAKADAQRRSASKRRQQMLAAYQQMLEQRAVYMPPEYAFSARPEGWEQPPTGALPERRSSDGWILKGLRPAQ